MWLLLVVLCKLRVGILGDFLGDLVLCGLLVLCLGGVFVMCLRV